MKMNDKFGAKIVQTQSSFIGVKPHIILTKKSLTLMQKDTLFASLPIYEGNLLMADKDLSFLIALLTMRQKELIKHNPNIEHVGVVNVDIEMLSTLIKDGMKMLLNPNIEKEIL